MTRKRRRTSQFDLQLEILEEGFIRPPSDGQRNWLLNRFMREAGKDLEALDASAGRFVPGGPRDLPADMRHAALTDAQIMEDWQLPLMEAMAAIAAASGGDLLEIGFGRGVSADMIQAIGVRSHTIIECNASILDRLAGWRATHPRRDIRPVAGLWQDVLGGLDLFDAIFFHTYALDEDESAEYLSGSVTFAEHFFPFAAAHLRPGGVFTYLSNEIDSLGREHQRLLLAHFRQVRLERITLALPPDVRDAWWADSMVVVAAVK